MTFVKLRDVKNEADRRAAIAAAMKATGGEKAGEVAGAVLTLMASCPSDAPR